MRNKNFHKKQNNPMWGRTHTAEARKAIGAGTAGELNGQWKGDKVGYNSLHRWVTRHFPKPNVCEICKDKKPIDLANKTGIYSRDLNNWQWLCRKCHMVSDGRLANLRHNKIKGHTAKCGYCGEDIWVMPCYQRKYCSKHCSNKGRLINAMSLL